MMWSNGTLRFYGPNQTLHKLWKQADCKALSYEDRDYQRVTQRTYRTWVLCAGLPGACLSKPNGDWDTITVIAFFLFLHRHDLNCTNQRCSLRRDIIMMNVHILYSDTCKRVTKSIICLCGRAASLSI